MVTSSLASIASIPTLDLASTTPGATYETTSGTSLSAPDSAAVVATSASAPAATEASPSTTARLAPKLLDPAPELVAGRRPADVLGARSRFVPNLNNISAYGGLALADAQRAQQLVHEVVAELPTPKILVNRRFEGAEAQLKSRAAFPTMFDIPEGKRPGDFAQRKQVEERFGTFGEGPDAGRSVYGSVQFADRVAPRPANEGARSAKAGAGLLNTGIQFYGPVSLVLKPDVWARTTVHPGDSYGLGATTRVGAVENLADVATERLGLSGRANLVEAITKPDDEARTTMKDYLTGRTMLENHGMMEAVVRTAATSDIAEVRILRHPEAEPRSDMERAIDRIRYAAKKLGVPVHQRTATEQEAWSMAVPSDQLVTSAPKPRASLPKGYATADALASVNLLHDPGA